ncbi:hypothetical protein CLAFUW4_06645 [Fulvia fulva]|nr:hypothetical protein CLAFUR4_06653 [Fulvia fulva]WPV16014.1 hypothetical protein CLAFUW4_06645 [Fulvia fulva]WPV31108.1 hypothetical protein CLAFUW7_06644 [Fulvia fulva]
MSCANLIARANEKLPTQERTRFVTGPVRLASTTTKPRRVEKQGVDADLPLELWVSGKNCEENLGPTSKKSERSLRKQSLVFCFLAEHDCQLQAVDLPAINVLRRRRCNSFSCIEKSLAADQQNNHSSRRDVVVGPGWYSFRTSNKLSKDRS